MRQVVIRGNLTQLRSARLSDRRKIFEWLTASDITPSMIGPPNYPDHPIPSWDEFKRDYRESFFTEDKGSKGKNYIILVNDIEVGTIGYDHLDLNNSRVDLDIWMRAEKFCGCGYGPDAINSLIEYLRNTFGVIEFSVDPSRRNIRAIKAYIKSGFEEVKTSTADCPGDYRDTVRMIYYY